MLTEKQKNLLKKYNFNNPVCVSLQHNSGYHSLKEFFKQFHYYSSGRESYKMYVYAIKNDNIFLAPYCLPIIDILRFNYSPTTGTEIDWEEIVSEFPTLPTTDDIENY